MGQCGTKKSAYEAHEEGGEASDTSKPPRKTMTLEEIRSSRARDSMRFNNRKSKPTSGEDGGSSNGIDNGDVLLAAKRQRDSMVFNNKHNSAQHKQLQLATISVEDFVCGCRDVLRSPILLDRISDIVDDGVIPYDGLDLLCVSMIPRDPVFKFYSQDSLRHSLFATCDGPSDVKQDVYDDRNVPAAKVLPMLRNMFFLKRMSLCFDLASGSPLISKETFAEACQRPESVFKDGDASALYDRVAAKIAGDTSDLIDWRHLVTEIAET